MIRDTLINNMTEYYQQYLLIAMLKLISVLYEAMFKFTQICNVYLPNCKVTLTRFYLFFGIDLLPRNASQELGILIA